MRIFHSIAGFLVFPALLVFLICLFRLFQSVARYFPRHMDIVFDEVKHAILTPSHLLISSADFLFGSLWPMRFLCLFFSVLLFLEGYRYSGRDLKIDSYTEYPYAKTCMTVQVHDVFDKSSKYYSLPASIVRDEDDDGNAVHIIERAYWSNGGYLDFTGDYPVEVLVGTPSQGWDQDGNEWDILLTNVPASHPRVSVTQPSFNILVGFLYFFAFIFLFGFFNPKYPSLHYLQVLDLRDLPPDFGDICEKAVGFLDEETADRNYTFPDPEKYAISRVKYYEESPYSLKGKLKMPLPKEFTCYEKFIIYECADHGVTFFRKISEIENHYRFWKQEY